MNKNKIKMGLITLYLLLFLVNAFLLFFLAKPTSSSGSEFKGHIVPWVIAIIEGVVGIAFILPWVKITKLNPGLIIIYGTLLTANLLMITFSILDIVGVQHYGVSTIMFITVPLITLVVTGLRKIK